MTGVSVPVALKKEIKTLFFGYFRSKTVEPRQIEQYVHDTQRTCLTVAVRMRRLNDEDISTAYWIFLILRVVQTSAGSGNDQFHEFMCMKADIILAPLEAQSHGEFMGEVIIGFVTG